MKESVSATPHLSCVAAWNHTVGLGLDMFVRYLTVKVDAGLKVADSRHKRPPDNLVILLVI